LPRGNNETYLLARLKRDAPALADRDDLAIQLLAYMEERGVYCDCDVVEKLDEGWTLPPPGGWQNAD
jgi:hypothetical protein